VACGKEESGGSAGAASAATLCEGQGSRFRACEEIGTAPRL
jgi:hypothetical protein